MWNPKCEHIKRKAHVILHNFAVKGHMSFKGDPITFIGIKKGFSCPKTRASDTCENCKQLMHNHY